MELTSFYGYDYVSNLKWTTMDSTPSKAITHTWYGTPPSKDSALKQQMSELPLIDDGKAKVQQIRDRQNEKKKKVRERKLNQKKQTVRANAEREGDDDYSDD